MQARKKSKKREAILELLRNSKTHPEVQWVYERLKAVFPDISLGTVYRNIRILIEEGQLASAGVINGEEHFDSIPLPHSHAICTVCGQIADLDEKIPDKLSGIFSDDIPGFTIDIRKTVFYGLCDKCSRETAALGR